MNLVVVREPKQNGALNMRLDEDLLEGAERGIVGARVYAWDGPWVSVGRFQSVERDLVDAQTTPWVRRPTGGKAVLHGHDVTIGCAFPLATLAVSDPRSIRSVYRVAVQTIVHALSSCGLNAVLAADSEFHGKGVPSGDCFAFSSQNDIVDIHTGRKICGCALRLTDSAVLLQASVPNGPPLVDPASVILNAESATPLSWNDEGIEIALQRSILAAVGVS